jgi:hypothetical protein
MQMSYWAYLIPEGAPRDGGITVEVPHFQEGGTQPLGGTTSAEINITYNYAKHFKFRSLDGKLGFETVRPLAEAVIELKNDVDMEDYWNPTEGNVRRVCERLLQWAGLHPFAMWHISD